LFLHFILQESVGFDVEIIIERKVILESSVLRMYVGEKQADLKNVGRRGSADLQHIYVA